jgi:antitoxin PrlF
MTELTRLSSRGQVVIPQSIREEMGLEEGTPLAITGKKNMIILKVLETPDLESEWEKIFEWGQAYAKRKGIKPEDVDKAIKEYRANASSV